MKKILLGICAALILICAVGCSKSETYSKAETSSKSETPDFKALYDEYCSSVWAEVGDDGSYLYIDTNPDNEDDYFSSTAYDAVLEVNKAIGLPDALTKFLERTTSSMGLQEKTYEDLGVNVSWTYHPDNGLEIIYTAP